MTAESVVLDRIDREILGILADDARIGWTELGARVHLSPNAVAERVRRLVRSGVIRRFTVEVDQARLGRTLEAIIEVRVTDSTRFLAGALSCDEVVRIAHVTGRTDYLLDVACDGTATLNRLLTRLRDEFGAGEVLTAVVLDRPTRVAR